MRYFKVDNADRIEIRSALSGEWEGMSAETREYRLLEGHWVYVGEIEGRR